MAKSIVVVGKGKAEKTFMVTADTKIMKGKEALKFEDLKAGMKVDVEYKMDMGKMVAGAIKVSAPRRRPHPRSNLGLLENLFDKKGTLRKCAFFIFSG